MSNVGTNGRACVWLTFVDPSQPCAVIVIVQLCPFSIIQAATRTLQPAKTTSALLDCRLQLCTLFRRSWRIALASIHALTDSLLLQMCRRLLACNIRHGCGLNRLGKSKTPARIAASAFHHDAKARFPTVAPDAVSPTGKKIPDYSRGETTVETASFGSSDRQHVTRIASW